MENIGHDSEKVYNQGVISSACIMKMTICKFDSFYIFKTETTTRIQNRNLTSATILT